MREIKANVKTIQIEEEPTFMYPGRASFVFRNSYSVFDWGEMPSGHLMDNRPLAVITAYNFERIKKMGYLACYQGVRVKDRTVSLDEALKSGEVPDTLVMRFVNIYYPTQKKDGSWDYSRFLDCLEGGANFLLPLEFIWRARAGPESSFWKNIDRGVYKLEDFGLPADIERGAPFPQPILDHSSKYETTGDRYFPPETARMLVGLSEEHWEQLNAMRSKINDWLTQHAMLCLIERPDGKQEIATWVDESRRVFALADAVGTYHEDRFIYDDGETKVKISKQLARDFNKLLNPEWAELCDKMKQRAQREGLDDFKPLVKAALKKMDLPGEPLPLEDRFFEVYNNLTRAMTNAWIGQNIFTGATPLAEAAKEAKAYFDDYRRRLTHYTE